MSLKRQKKHFFYFIALILLFSFVPSVFAQQDGVRSPDEVVAVEARVLNSPGIGGTAELEIVISIDDGWHINANKPLDEFLIPTSIYLQADQPLADLTIDYPEAKFEKFAFSEKGMAVYSHQAILSASFTMPRGASDGLRLNGKLDFQTCNDAICLPPAQKEFHVQIPAEPAATKFDAAVQFGNAASETLAGLGQQSDEAKVRTEVQFSLDKVLAGGEVKVAVILDIADGWHINSNKPHDEFLIPTELRFDEIPGVQIGSAIYPPDKLFQFTFSEEKVAVFQGRAVVAVPVKLDANFADAQLRISGTVNYQACNDNSCLAPTSTTFSSTLPIARRDEAIALANYELFENVAASTENDLSDNEISGLIAENGLALTFLLIFFGGLALNLTPCVYPLIPITVSFFGGQAKGSTAKVFTLALVYLLGMSITYSAMGLVAALSGSLFGSLLQNPFVLIGIAAIMTALALSMFGVWELTIPQSLNQMAGGSKQGYLGSLFMGLTVGIVAAPCIGPFVLGLLTYVSTIGDPMLGFWMFFTLSLGLGLPYVVLGTFSASLKNLPRSGMWMIWVKKIFGFVLLGMAAYFVKPILPQTVAVLVLPIILLAGGVFVGFLDRTQMASKAFPAVKKLVGVVFIAAAAWLLWPTETVHDESWQVYSSDLLAQASAEGKPVIIDFTADWCISCQELEKLTFPSEPVMQRADKFYMLRADLTKFASPPVEKIKQTFNIKGLPTVIFIDSNGEENKNLRVIGFVDGDDFARRMDELLVKMSN